MRKNRLSNYKRNEISVALFPPLPVQSPPLSQPRTMTPISLIIGVIVSLGLIALLIFVVPWQSVSQTFTGTLGSLYVQAKQIKLPQIKLPQREKPGTEVSTAETLAIEVSSLPPIPEPDPNLLVGRYPVRKYMDIRYTVSRGDWLYHILRQYRNRIFPKKYRNWQLLAQYNRIRSSQYILKPGEEFLIPTLAHIALPKTGYETELQQIQSKLANQPEDPVLLNRLAIIHFKRYKLNESRSILQQGIKLSPHNGVLHNNLGFIYLIVEEDAKAQHELELAIAHSEKPAIPHCNLGVLYMTMGKLDLAIEALESALEADANLLDAKYNLALAYEKVGQINPAKEYLRALAQILLDDAEVKSALERLNTANE